MCYKRVSYVGLETYLDWGFLLCWSIFATLFRLRNQFSFCLNKKGYILSWFVDFGSLRRPSTSTMVQNISESKSLFSISRKKILETKIKMNLLDKMAKYILFFSTVDFCFHKNLMFLFLHIFFFLIYHLITLNNGVNNAL